MPFLLMRAPTVLLVVAHDAGHLLLADGGAPVAHAAGIDVEEARGAAAGAVVADAAHLADEGGIAHLLGRHVGEIDVDGLAHHVLALAGHVAADLLEEGVGLGRAVAGDDVDRALGTEIGVQFPHQVDGPGRNGDDFVPAPVAQDVVDLLHGGRDVLPVLHVGDREAFLGVDLVERERAGFAARDRGRIPAEIASRRNRRHDGGRCERLFPTLNQGVTMSGFPAVQTHTPLTTGLLRFLWYPVQPAQTPAGSLDYTETAFRTRIRPP